MTPNRALLMDWGGVLTSSPLDAMVDFAEREGLPYDSLVKQMRTGGTVYKPFIELELGHITDEQFEKRFAAGLQLGPARALGLRRRLFQTMRPDQPMRDAVSRIRRSGIRVGLLSNSVGSDGYEQAVVDELFDVTVISREVGLRKPEPAIYETALERIGCEPATIVFVDDLRANLKPARDLGMTTILHRDAKATVEVLGRLFPGAALAAPR